MPVDPNHRYADEAHPSTMTGAGWRYACWTLSDEYRRDRPGVTLVQDGWTEDGRRIMVEIQRTPKHGVACGHIPPNPDPACDGCVLSCFFKSTSFFLTKNKVKLCPPT